MGAILEFFGSLAAIIKTFVVGKNTSAEVAAQTGANIQADKAKIEKDIASGDVNAIGRDIS